MTARADHSTWGGRRDRTLDPISGQKIGRSQLGCLIALREYGAYPGGWLWINHSSTRKILDSLVARGLVTRESTINGSVYRPVPFNRREDQ